MKIHIPASVANWLIRRAQRTPYFNLVGYMNRWWLKRPAGHGAHNDVSEVHKTGWGARIHQTLRSDEDRALHDHPWANCSIVLRGGYWEVMEDGSRIWRGPGSVVFRKATAKHRLIVPEGAESWSLFIMGHWRRDWGFWPTWGWTYWRDYLGGLLDDSIVQLDTAFLEYVRRFGAIDLYETLGRVFDTDQGAPQYLHHLTPAQRAIFAGILRARICTFDNDTATMPLGGD